MSELESIKSDKSKELIKKIRSIESTSDKVFYKIEYDYFTSETKMYYLAKPKTE